MPGGVVLLPLRCTVIQTERALIMISPIDFSDQQWAEIAKLGEVTDIVAPSLLHHLYLPKAVVRYPKATVWGAPGFENKCPEIRWSKIFLRDKWSYGDEIEALFIEGTPAMNEMAFLDKPSRTLIVADLCFNIRNPEGWGAPLMLRLLGTHKKFAVSRLINRYLKDKTAFQNSMKNLLRFDFDAIAMSHGELIESGGKSKLTEALTKSGFNS